MALFKPLTTKTTVGDPFLDAVISMSSDNNVQYTSIKALRNSDVFTAVKIISSDVASSPIELLGNNTDNDNLNYLNHLLNVKPNKQMDGWHLKFTLMANMLLNGNSYAEIIKRNGKIEAIQFIPNSYVTVKQKDNGDLIYQITADNQKTRTVTEQNMLHFKYFTTDGLVGISPLYALQDELKIQGAGNRTLFNFFSRGVNGSGILKVNKSDLDLEAKQAIREKFEEANGSSDGDNALRTIILDDTMEYKTLEINTDVLRLVNSSDFQTKQIAKVFGISADKLAVENQHTSTKQANAMYLQNTLLHHCEVFSAELNRKLLESNQYTFKLDTQRLLQGDPEEELASIVKSVQGSIMTVNEARKKLKLPAVNGGDRLLASLNYTHLDNLEKYQFKEGSQELDG